MQQPTKCSCNDLHFFSAIFCIWVLQLSTFLFYNKQAVDTLVAAPTEGHLWECIAAFQNYPFHTVSGLPFSYTLKKGRNGEYTKELFIDRRENSKSLAWSSMRIVFERALEQQGAVFNRPKELANVRGVSYTFSLLWRFGMISVPEDVERKLKGNRR